MQSSEISQAHPDVSFARPAVFQSAPEGRFARVWLNALLFLATLITTCAAGSRMQYNFDHDLPFFNVDRDFNVFWQWWSHPATLVPGLSFSLTLLTILLAHEFGHYVACVYYRADASLPYFLPFPTFTGTLGAFIRIRSAIYSKRALFDIGVSGPIAGFLFLLPALTVGLALSKVIPNIESTGSIRLGTPLLLRFFEMLIFPGVPASDIYLHPVVRAAWVALFATALNLLPAGQLDGGHIIYSLFGSWHRWITRLVMAALIPLGFFCWYGWLIWAVLLLFFGRKHPSIYDDERLGRPRLQLAWAALAIFILCFTATPTFDR